MTTQLYDLTYLSLGGGVQSTTMLALSALGLRDVPKADIAIFADTQSEVRDTYDHIAFLTRWAGERGIPVKTVTVGNLGAQIVGDQKARQSGYQISIPAFTAGERTGGILRRQCTAHYKLDPIRRTVRETLGLKPRAIAAGRFRVRALIGIFARRSDWAWLKRERPEAFAQAVVIDRRIRDQTRAGVKKPVFLHDSRRPLGEIEFGEPNQLRLEGVERAFGNECEGMCGV